LLVKHNVNSTKRSVHVLSRLYSSSNVSICMKLSLVFATFRKNGTKTSVYKFWSQPYKKRSQLCRLMTVLKLSKKQYGVRVWLYSTVKGCCEHGNKSSDSI